MTTDLQIPEGFRRANRWQLALKIWGLTSLVVGALGTLALIAIEWAVAGHVLHWIWQLALVGFGVAAVADVPLAVRVLREYPAQKYWK